MNAKKIISAILASLIAISTFAGCSTETNSNTDSKSSDTNLSSKVEKKEEKPVEIKIFSTYTASTEPEASKFMIAEMEKAINVKLDRIEVPASAYNEKLQLSLASNDYPDAYMFDNHNSPLLLSGVDNGLFIPVNDYIANAPDLLAHTEKETFEVAKVKNDENIYLIPRTSITRADGYVLRKDWLDKIEFEFKSGDSLTKDEFRELNRAFAKDDPDGDGQNNTYGAMFYSTDGGNLGPVGLGAFDCIGWQKSDGKYKYMNPVYEIGNANYRKALEYTCELWLSGSTHPDGPVTKDPNVPFYNGEYGIGASFAGHMASRENDTKKINPKAELVYCAGIENDEGEFLGPVNAGIWGGYAITKDCKNPQKIADMFNYILSDEGWQYALYGQPDITYKLEGGKPITITDKYKEYKGGMGAAWALSVARRCDDPNFFLDLSLPTEQLDSAANCIQIAMDAGVKDLSLGKVPAIATDSSLVDASNTLREVQTKVIMGVSTVEDYDKALENWYKKGGETYVTQMLEIIDKLQSSK